MIVNLCIYRPLSNVDLLFHLCCASNWSIELTIKIQQKFLSTISTNGTKSFDALSNSYEIKSNLGKMASRASLKSDLKLLKETFSKDHERFRISHAAVDQLTTRFIGENYKNYDIHANIPVKFNFCFEQCAW